MNKAPMTVTKSYPLPRYAKVESTPTLLMSVHWRRYQGACTKAPYADPL